MNRKIVSLNERLEKLLRNMANGNYKGVKQYMNLGGDFSELMTIIAKDKRINYAIVSGIIIRESIDFYQPRKARAIMELASEENIVEVAGVIMDKCSKTSQGDVARAIMKFTSEENTVEIVKAIMEFAHEDSDYQGAVTLAIMNFTSEENIVEIVKAIMEFTNKESKGEVAKAIMDYTVSETEENELFSYETEVKVAVALIMSSEKDENLRRRVLESVSDDNYFAVRQALID